MKIRITPQDALIVVDVQNDFCRGGTLAVPEGDKVVKPINKILELFTFVFFTRDWHPKNSVHFKEWPVHCVQGTKGAEFHPKLSLVSNKIKIISKGKESHDKGGYSGFEGSSDISFSLNMYLEVRKIKRLIVCGLATDYCVKATVLDGLKKGYEVIVVLDAIRAVNKKPGDGEKALKEMEKAGVGFVTSDQIL